MLRKPDSLPFPHLPAGTPSGKLPAFTFLDPNYDTTSEENPQDIFDFSKAAFAKPPRLASAPGLERGLDECHAAGLNPPLPGAASPAGHYHQQI